MCDPISIAIALATAGGSALFQNMAAKKVDKARTGVVQRANKDLDKLRDEANLSYRKSINTSTPEAVSTQMQKSGTERADAYEQSVKSSEMLPGQGDASKAVRQSIVQTLAGGDQSSRDQARRRGAYDAYGEADFGRDIKMKREGQNIAQVGNFAQGRAGLVPLELEEANHAGDGMAEIAGLIQGLGAIGGGLYGAAGGAPASAAMTVGKGIGSGIGAGTKDFVKKAGLWQAPSWMKASW